MHLQPLSKIYTSMPSPFMGPHEVKMEVDDSPITDYTQTQHNGSANHASPLVPQVPTGDVLAKEHMEVSAAWGRGDVSRDHGLEHFGVSV